MDSWVRAYRHELDGDGVDPDALLEETKRRAPAVRLSTMRLINHFLENVARVSSGAAGGR
jgi:hypothetical protein